MQYSVFIFDFDGTVAYTCEDVWSSIAFACNCCNISLPDDFGCDNSKLALSSTEIYRRYTGVSNLEEEKKFANLIRYHYRNLNMFEKTCFYPEMERLLSELSSQAECYVASNKAEIALRRVMEMKSWNCYFKAVYGMPEGSGKNKSDMIREIIESRPDLEKEQFVYIGDTYSDVVAARNNGIACIGVTYGDGSTEELKKQNPEYLVSSSKELYDLIIGGADE